MGCTARGGHRPPRHPNPLNMNKNLENYTPHKIVVMNEDDEILFQLPSLGKARCDQDFHIVDRIAFEGHEVTVQQGKFGGTNGLPEPKENTLYIVSRIVAEANEDRLDLLMVFGTVRDDQNRIIGCRGFSRVRRGEMEMLHDTLTEDLKAESSDN